MSDDEPTKTDQTPSDPKSGAPAVEPRDAETDAIEQSLAQIEALSGTLQDLAAASPTDAPDKLRGIVDGGADDGGSNEADPGEASETQATAEDANEPRGSAALDEASAFLQSLEAELALEEQTSPPDDAPAADSPEAAEPAADASHQSIAVIEPAVQTAVKADDAASAVTPTAEASADEAPVASAPAVSTEENTIQQVDAALADEVGELLGGLTDAVDDVMRDSVDPATIIEPPPTDNEHDIMWDAPEPNAVRAAAPAEPSPDTQMASRAPAKEADTTPAAPEQLKDKTDPDEKAADSHDSSSADDEACKVVAPAESEERSGLWAKIEPPLIAILRPVSYPMRFVPSSMKPVVDWVALSLVIWVPIVWVLAVFVLGG